MLFCASFDIIKGFCIFKIDGKSDWQYVNDRPKFALLALLTPASELQLAFAPPASEKHFEKAEHSFVYWRRGQL